MFDIQSRFDHEPPHAQYVLKDFKSVQYFEIAAMKPLLTARVIQKLQILKATLKIDNMVLTCREKNIQGIQLIIPYWSGPFDVNEVHHLRFVLQQEQ